MAILLLIVHMQPLIAWCSQDSFLRPSIEILNHLSTFYIFSFVLFHLPLSMATTHLPKLPRAWKLVKLLIVWARALHFVPMGAQFTLNPKPYIRHPCRPNERPWAQNVGPWFELSSHGSHNLTITYIALPFHGL